MQPLTSIVILTRNEVAYTKKCVESIARHTPEPYELVFVDNGSTDETLTYLQSLPSATTTIIANDENRGFGGGCNQGIARSRGDYILLLNNDTVVTSGWLAALQHQFTADTQCGLVGPRSNYVAGTQLIDDVGYDIESLDGLEAWAAAYTKPNVGESWLERRLIGFCILLKRAVLDEIGGFDLRFGLGNFEDDDLCMRAAVAGWTARVAADAYVHHFGSRTFIAEDIDYQESLLKNWHIFVDAWRMTPDLIPADGSGYLVEKLVARTLYNPARHYAPLVGKIDRDTDVSIERRQHALLVPCDRHHPEVTDSLISACLDHVCATDEITLVVRIDPRDEDAYSLLEQHADRCEAAGRTLPDIVVVELSDDDDGPVLRVVDLAVIAGEASWALVGYARHLGVVPVTTSDIAGALNLTRAA